ncbi:MAG: metallophosphoesterase [Comamonas sp.]|jgi:predicted MPP superfamily phosphohydrolase|uniref:metallophosphoesterase n=1 Tax=Comamonas sp. TaxID=34028 RepID=UPI0028266E07|nr:metallophosphoesterase [Comamonas sp.]MDR0215242.1 metallophosphoesterase [Comamonas sp.]
MVVSAALFIPLLALWLWWPCRLSRLTRIALVVLTALVGIFPALLLKAAQTGVLAYTTIAPLQVPGGWVLATLLMLLILVLLRDGVWLAGKLLGKPRWSGAAHTTAPTLAALVLTSALSGLGVYNALQPPQIKEIQVPLSQLPQGLEGLRIAVLADIHASPVNDALYVQTIVDRTLAAKPDLIVLPGDLVDGDTASGRQNIAPLAQLHAPYGVWVAPGNHEYYSGYDSWMAEFQRLGLNLLENRMQLIEVDGAKLALSGIGDPVYGRTSPYNRKPDVPEGIAPDVAAVARQATAAKADFHVLLAHQPKFARDNADYGIDLQISGHTHGGLIRGMDRLLVAPVNNGFVRGSYDVDKMRLIVSSGAGLWAGFAVRLGISPRIEVLTLQRQVR